MGQYHCVVNLDKREYVHPHKLGCGLKLWEQLANGGIGGTGGALLVLLACSNGRGGGDFDTGENWHGPERTCTFEPGTPDPPSMPNDYPTIAARTIGRWAGDRIAVVGDYAEDGDLAPEHHAGLVYTLCGDPADVEDTASYYASDADGKDPDRAALLRSLPVYTDISDDVLAVLTHELHLEIIDMTGWRQITRED